MMIILFRKNNRNKLHGVTASDIVVHAHPASRPMGVSGLQEYYLEGYGSEVEGLEKITMPEIAVSMRSHERIELL
jgi:hypothetical protein